MTTLRTFIDIISGSPSPAVLAETSNMKQSIFEMPQLSTGPLDLGYGNPDINVAEVRRLTIDQPYTTLEDNAPFILGQSVIDGSGEFFLINRTLGKMVYYTHYEESDFPGLGLVANEATLWRQSGAGYPNITSRVFLGYMMDQYEAIISDRRHSPDGRRFWVDRMGDAITRGWTVGLLNGDDFVAFPGGDLQSWLGQVEGWGETASFMDKQFMITKHGFESG